MEDDAGRGAPGGEPGLSPGTGEKAQGADAAGAVAEGGGGTKARRRAEQEQDRSAHPRHHVGDTMQRQAHGRYREDRQT